MKILILGANGFIGHSLTTRILDETDWQVFAMDIGDDRIQEHLGHPNFRFLEGDIGINREWIEYHIKKCDVALPLVAIATPFDYVRNPIRVFELDFEENLRIVRLAVKYGARVIFPSTSEIYGMSEDRVFVVTQFLGHLLRGEPIRLVEGGDQRRCITDIRDGVDALMRILRNEGGRADGRILNIGNPENDCSIAELASLLIDMLSRYPRYPRWAGLRDTAVVEKVLALDYYGEGYQDILTRVPDISNARECIGWEPRYGLEEALANMVHHYVSAARWP